MQSRCIARPCIGCACRVQREGDNGFADGRHGHPVKLRGEVLTFLIEFCQATPSVASSVLQHAIIERFASAPGVSQLNRVRARLGLSRQPVPREIKPQAAFFLEPGYHEHVRGLLLLAAANETALIAHLTEALPAELAEGRPPLLGNSAWLRGFDVSG